MSELIFCREQWDGMISPRAQDDGWPAEEMFLFFIELRYDDGMNHAGEAILIFTQRNQAPGSYFGLLKLLCGARTINTYNKFVFT